MTWMTKTPTQPGWYWFRNVQALSEKEPRMVFVRDYGGVLAVGNCRIEGFTLYENGEWAGPIAPPSESHAAQAPVGDKQGEETPE